MTVVAGVDFGTLSARVTLVDSKKGPIGTASASYPLHRRREDPNYATQAHADQMTALAAATREVLKTTGVDGGTVAAIALDTTGSSVVPVGEGLEPLDEYYLWCDHRAFGEAQEITKKAHEVGFEGIEWCGGVYSHEWGFSKLLHWLRQQPGEARALCDGAGALRHGGGHAERDYEGERAEAQRMRHGPQVDVESRNGADCPRRAFWWQWTRCLQAFAARWAGSF